jgi:hypothetical protein
MKDKPGRSKTGADGDAVTTVESTVAGTTASGSAGPRRHAGTGGHFQVWFSARAETLAERLIEEIRAETAGDPLVAPVIITPNAPVERWLEMRMVAADGIAANLDFPFVATGIRRLIQRLGPSTSAPRVVDRDGLKLRLIERLSDAPPSGRLLAGYLGANQPEPPLDRSRRLWDLADRLAELFGTYDRDLPELIDAWREHPAIRRGERGIACEERALFNEILGTGRPEELLMPCEALRRSLAGIGSAGDSARAAPLIHIFMPEPAFFAFHALYLPLWRAVRARVYLIAPVRGFWRKETRANSRTRLTGLDPKRLADETPWLESWKELLNRLAGIERALGASRFDAVWLETATPSCRERSGIDDLHARVLAGPAPAKSIGGEIASPPDGTPVFRPASFAHAGLKTGVPLKSLAYDKWSTDVLACAMKPSMRTAAPPKSAIHGAGGTAWPPAAEGGCPTCPLPRSAINCREEDPAADESTGSAIAGLKLFSAPGEMREVETVLASVLHHLELDPALCFTDIAILAPDIDRYRPIIQSVFSRGPFVLPLVFLDSGGADAGDYGRGVLSLFALAGGEALRPELAELLRNPCFLAATGWSGSDLEIVERLIETLGLFRGGDGATPCDWRHGLRRLRLGRIMSSPDPDAASNRLADWRDLVPADLSTLPPGAVAEAAARLELLFDDLDDLRGRRHLGEWAGRTREVAARWLAPGPGDRMSETVRDAFLRGLAAIRSAPTLAAAEVEADFAREMARHQLAGLAVARGRFLADGITIATPVALAALPFRLVFAIGLNENAFPGRDFADPLDLRSETGVQALHSSARRNELAFRERLLAARERLYISWRHRELDKDRPEHSSPVIRDLADLLGGLLPAPVEMPIQPASRRYCEASDESGMASPASRHPDLFALHDPIDGEAAWRRFDGARALDVAESAPVTVHRPITLQSCHGRARVLAGHMSQSSQSGLWPARTRALPGQNWSGERLRAPAAIAIERLPIKRLAAFLKDPMNGLMEMRLGLPNHWDDDEDEMAEECEPFFPDEGEFWRLRRRILDEEVECAAQGSGAGARGRAERRYRFEELSGRLPAGDFGGTGIRASGAYAEKTAALLARFLADGGWQYLGSVSAGEGEERDASSRQAPGVVAPAGDAVSSAFRIEGCLRNLFVRRSAADENREAASDAEAKRKRVEKAALEAIPIEEREFLTIVSSRKDVASGEILPSAVIEPGLFFLLAHADRGWHGPAAEFGKILGGTALTILVVGPDPDPDAPETFIVTPIWKRPANQTPVTPAEYIVRIIHDLFTSRPGVALRLSCFATKSMLEKASGIIGTQDLARKEFVEKLETAMKTSAPFNRNRTRLDEIIKAELPDDAIEIIDRRIIPLAGFFGWPPPPVLDQCAENPKTEKASARKPGRGKKVKP